MGLFGRLLGKKPPRIPAGGRPFVAHCGTMNDQWCVRVQMPGQEPDATCCRVGPTFDQMMTAEAYRAWCAGEAPAFAYPEGAA